MTKTYGIVGAGINGLLTAYELAKQPEDPAAIHVYDEGGDPRSDQANLFGASYTGLDARHISIIESRFLATPERAELLGRSVLEGGWNLLADKELLPGEQDWLQQNADMATTLRAPLIGGFVLSALNEAGMKQWRTLAAEQSIFKPSGTDGILRVGFSDEASFAAYPTRERHAGELAPVGFADHKAFRHGLSVAGDAYAAKTLCGNLIEFLEDRGVRFAWNTRVDDTNSGLLPEHDTVIYSPGIGSQASTFLQAEGVAIAGLVGCWARLPEANLPVASKIMSHEPISFINCTPGTDGLQISGGYGWIGQRPLAEVADSLHSLKQQFSDRISEIFDAPIATDEVIVCPRPVTPSGVPAVKRSLLPDGREVIINVGHGSAGFTQAPHLAKRIADLCA